MTGLNLYEYICCIQSILLWYFLEIFSFSLPDSLFRFSRRLLQIHIDLPAFCNAISVLTRVCTPCKSSCLSLSYMQYSIYCTMHIMYSIYTVHVHYAQLQGLAGKLVTFVKRIFSKHVRKKWGRFWHLIMKIIEKIEKHITRCNSFVKNPLKYHFHYEIIIFWDKN